MRRAMLSSSFRDNNTLFEKFIASVEQEVKSTDKYITQLKNKLAEYKSGQQSQGKYLEKLAALLSHLSDTSPNNNDKCKNSSFQPALQEVAFIINTLNQHIQVLGKNIDEDVITTLGNFKITVKQLQEDLKKAGNASYQEQLKKKQLQRVQLLRDGKPGKISEAEAQLLKAKGEQMKTAKSLEEHSQIFQLKKMTEVRRAFLSWVTSELRYHARALELFTGAYTALSQMDPATDIKEFRKNLYYASNDSTVFDNSISCNTRAIHNNL